MLQQSWNIANSVSDAGREGRGWECEAKHVWPLVEGFRAKPDGYGPNCGDPFLRHIRYLTYAEASIELRSLRRGQAWPFVLYTLFVTPTGNGADTVSLQQTTKACNDS